MVYFRNLKVIPQNFVRLSVQHEWALLLNTKEKLLDNWFGGLWVTTRPPELPAQPNNSTENDSSSWESLSDSRGNATSSTWAGWHNGTLSVSESVSVVQKRPLFVCFSWLTFEPQNIFLFALWDFKRRNLLGWATLDNWGCLFYIER